MSGELLATGESPELRAKLRIAAGDRRLTDEELEERVEAALIARTMGEPAVLTADLPAGAAPGVARTSYGSSNRVRRPGVARGGWCRGGWRSVRHGAR
jgi:hypothetical protein